MWKRHFTFLPKILLRPFCLLVRKFSFLKDHIAGVTISGDYDKDRVINNISIVHSDSDYNKYISNSLNHYDKKNKKQIKYHLKLP